MYPHDAGSANLLLKPFDSTPSRQDSAPGSPGFRTSGNAKRLPRRAAPADLVCAIPFRTTTLPVF